MWLRSVRCIREVSAPARRRTALVASLREAVLECLSLQPPPPPGGRPVIERPVIDARLEEYVDVVGKLVAATKDLEFQNWGLRFPSLGSTDPTLGAAAAAAADGPAATLPEGIPATDGHDGLEDLAAFLSFTPNCRCAGAHEPADDGSGRSAPGSSRDLGTLIRCPSRHVQARLRDSASRGWGRQRRDIAHLFQRLEALYRRLAIGVHPDRS